ncbi:MAG: orotate phosphoribosyltransferase [Christensenellales bacterium]|jgi:orotate phosphoribosyltransferase
MSTKKTIGGRLNENLTETLEKAGVISDVHHILTSGKHAVKSIQCARLFENPPLCRDIFTVLARQFEGEGIDVVLGPALGGIIPAYELSRILGARNIFCERENGAMKLRRGYYINPGEKVLIAEDVITTGGSVRITLSLVEEMGGIPAGICAVADLSSGRASFDLPMAIAAQIDLISYSQEECPLCASGVPLEHRASRAI